MEKNLQIIKNFVEGEIDLKQFYDYSITNEFLDFLSKIEDKFAKYIEKLDNYQTKNKTLVEYTKNLNIKNVESVYDFQIVCGDILWLFNIEHKNTDKYIKAVWENNIIPDQLPDSAQDWVEENILNKLPDGLSKTKKSKIVKEEIKKVFPCRTRKPSWVQGTEDWPTDSDGNNLTFIKLVEDGDQVTQIFENEKPKEQKKIIEYY